MVSVIAPKSGDARFFVEGKLVNIATPDVFVEDPTTHQVYDESHTSPWRSMDAIYGQIGITGILWPFTTMYELIKSYSVPREILSTRADYEMPPYHDEHERMALSPNGIYPGNEYVGMPLENIEYGGSINWKKFTKDFEKFLKEQKKEIKNNYKAGYEVEI